VQDRYLVTAMTERQLRMVITEPAKRAGSSVDDDLTELLLREMRDRQPVASGAGMLPLLSHALDQAWRRRSSGVLTLADYERTGGIERAVADSAQRAYDRLTSAQKTAARQVFTRLVATHSDETNTADRAARADLTEGKSPAEVQDVEAVLDAFTAERLLTLAAGTVEISHEILLTAWPLLRDTWLADTLTDRIVRTRLRNTAAEWAQHSRDRSYLYGGSLLESAVKTADRIASSQGHHPPLSRIETDFLEASSRAARRARATRWSAVGALVILLAASLAATFVARSQTSTAIHQRDLATRQRTLAVSGELAAQSQALVGSDPVLSRLLGLAAWRLDPSAQARYSMLNAAAQPNVADLPASNNVVGWLAFSPNGQYLVTSGPGTMQLWNATNYQPDGPPVNTKIFASSAKFSPNSKILAIGNRYPGLGQGSVRLWDVSKRTWLGAPITSTDGLTLVGFGSSGKKVITLARNTVVQWNVASHRQVGKPMALTGEQSVIAATVSPSGSVLATADYNHNIWLWNLRNGHEIGKPLATASPGPVYSIAFSPNGRYLAAGGLKGRVWLWNIAQGGAGHTFIGGSGPVYSVAFSPDSSTLAVGSIGNGTVRLWDVAARNEVSRPLVTDDGGVFTVAFSSDGHTLAYGGGNGIVQLWDITDGSEAGPPMPGGGSFANSVAFSPDGRRLAALEDGCRLKLWTLPSRTLSHTAQTVTCPHNLGFISRFSGLIGIASVAFSPNGHILATAGNVGPLKYGAASPLRLWNASNGRLIATFPVKAEYVAFSPDGRTLAVMTKEGTYVQIWDIAARRRLASFICNIASALNFSPNGHLLAVGGRNCNEKNRLIDSDAGSGVLLWSMDTHRRVAFLKTQGLGDLSSIAFSPNGKTLATAQGNDTVRIWNVAARHPIGDLVPSQGAVIKTLAFSPDGRTLAGGGNEGNIWLWDVATDREIGPPLLSPTNANITAVAFSPDEHMLATSGLDGSIRLWDVTFLVNPASNICTNTGRPLTQAEWRHYAHGVPYHNICPRTRT
jgi:WD40 repeat protein